jgi:hypothetical protein
MSESQDEEVASILSPPVSRTSPVPILKTSGSRSQSIESPPPRKLLHLRSPDNENEQNQDDSTESTETIVDGEKPAPESQEQRAPSDERLTLVVDGTRFVVSRRLFVSHPNTMLGR